jgi:hypothetical protein
MWREIDILRKAMDKDCAVVDKSTNILWSEEEVEQASTTDALQQEDSLLPPDGQIDISGLYPGCLQQHGYMLETPGYAPVGQTRHFVIFRTVDQDSLVLG